MIPRPSDDNLTRSSPKSLAQRPWRWVGTLLQTLTGVGNSEAIFWRTAAFSAISWCRFARIGRRSFGTFVVTFRAIATTACLERSCISVKRFPISLLSAHNISSGSQFDLPDVRRDGPFFLSLSFPSEQRMMRSFRCCAAAGRLWRRRRVGGEFQH